MDSVKGFTLIELLIVFAIVGILGSTILILIDPLDKIYSAHDSIIQNDIGYLGRSLESFSTRHGGNYPKNIQELITSGELKRAPLPPSGYGDSYNYIAFPDSCTGAIGEAPCTSVVITAPLKSRLYRTTPYQKYETSHIKYCQVVSPGEDCP